MESDTINQEYNQLFESLFGYLPTDLTESETEEEKKVPKFPSADKFNVSLWSDLLEHGYLKYGFNAVEKYMNSGLQDRKLKLRNKNYEKNKGSLIVWNSACKNPRQYAKYWDKFNTFIGKGVVVIRNYSPATFEASYFKTACKRPSVEQDLGKKSKKKLSFKEQKIEIHNN